MAWSGAMADMKKTSVEKAEEIVEMSAPCSIANVADYPYGLSITLTEEELQKLDLDDDCEIGDTIDLRAFAEVTSVSKHMVNDKASCRVELQIVKLSVENESTEEPGED